MEQVALYIPGLMGLAVALVAFVSVRHIASHRASPPEPRRASPGDAGEPRSPFDFVGAASVLDAPSNRATITVHPRQPAR